jgi:GTP-binding protein
LTAHPPAVALDGMERAAGTNRLFVDEVVIQVRAGKGGDGCVAFLREKFMPKGGPSGGDGGRGGSVYLVADDGMNTLLELAGKHHWHAENGGPGEGKNCHGKNGEDLTITVPSGTLVFDADTGALLKDMVGHGQSVRIARGGRGGYGNTHYASSTNQTPRQYQPGRRGQERNLRLELKLIADIGLVGLPNAGKSTLLSRLTNARPKIAPYPFTTKEPQLGILELPGYRRLVLADIPGLLEGAHEGVGLGDAFLRHIERTRVIAHLVDLCPPEGSPSPTEAYYIIRHELEKYSEKLAGRSEITIGNKIDLTGADDALAELRAAIDRPVIALSGVTGQGLRPLAEAMWVAVEEARKSEPPETPVRIDFGRMALDEGNDDDAAGESDEPLIDFGTLDELDESSGS